ncbi:MAG: transglutaminase-like cysteine peptidase [Alphaproteobacteria bacterium]
MTATDTMKRDQMNRRQQILGVFLALILVLSGASFSVAAQTPGLFGSTENRSTNLTMFSQWNNMLARIGKNTMSGNNADKSATASRGKDWQKFLSGEKAKDALAQIKDVNEYVNKISYVTDPVNYGVPDVWNTPDEFFMNNGDCEDYAVTKFISLKALGFPADQMRVVAVQDLNLKVGHAILAVYVKDHVLILDNQIKQVADAAGIKHYKPVFSINETAWWRHTSQ